ncbi:hypothetical protein GCM10009122_22750 [Fulvivirga kasyanovii]|uniref:Type II methyltransferase M.TaqI-like domain-containing protein n=1 Tax=Fulvivirga kasyanovii TaxID=396812 RepID=A0ABW9RQ56_9BACT|nr:N-6 DNA methylase [Fulvivirga kasyanovii]MTI26297.1 hypothetical protein [Fulvivirga kasyanovii]
MKAVTVEVVINKSGRKLELRFSESPGEDIQKQLRERGFASDGDNIWKATNTRERRAFADTLKASIEGVKELVLSLPFQPSSGNIDLKNFSFITFYSEREDGNLQLEDFIIFEPSKPKAQAIVNEFGHRHYGQRFKKVEIFPRNYQRDARKLLADGKVITKLPGSPITEEPKIKTPAKEPEVTKENLTNEHGIYTRETAGERYERIKIPIPSSAKYEASIELVETETGEYAIGLTHSKLFGNQSSKGFAPGMVTDRYPDRQTAMRLALMVHIERLEEQIGKEDSILDNEALKNKRLQKAIEAIYAYARSVNIDLPEPAGENITEPDNQVKEIEETVSSEQYDQAANYLDTLLRQIREGQHHQLLPFAVVTAKKRELKKPMALRGWEDFSKVITAKSFRDELKVNLWDLIPTAYKKEQAIQSIDWKADPDDEGLKKLLVKFTSESDTRKEMMGVFFDKDGIVATDSRKLLFIHHISDESKGLFCITKKCWHALAIANEPARFEEIEKERAEAFRKSVNYPDYKEVIPKDFMNATVVDAHVLLNYLSALKKSGMWYAKGVTIIKCRDLIIGFDMNFLYECVASMARLGHAQLEFGINGVDKLLLIAPQGGLKEAQGLKTDFAFVMPYLLDSIIKDDDAKGFLYFDLEAGEAKTFGVEGAPCPCEVKEVKKEEPEGTGKEAKTELPEKPGKETEQEELPPNAFLGENPVTDRQYAWEMTRLQFQEIMAIRKTGSPMVLNARDGQIHEALVIWAAQNGKPIAPANLETYPDVAAFLQSIPVPEEKEEEKLPEADVIERLNQLSSEIEPHDKKILERILQAPITLDNVPPEALQAYPELQALLKRQGFFIDTPYIEYGWDTIAFENKEVFKELLNLIGFDGITAVGQYPRIQQLPVAGYLWTGNYVRLLTASNPLDPKMDGYASFVAIRGPKEYLEPAVRFIEEQSGYKREENKYIGFDMYFTRPEIPLPGTETPSRFYLLDQVIAHMHEMYAEGRRATKGQIEKLAGELKVPNMGVMWEAVELSWLLWYRMLYRQTTPFGARLGEMIRFWNNVQPTYAYSDSSKELYRQYSTPCPIGAIVAQYTEMDQAKDIYEPSAGNGLLLVGAEPDKCHVNEIDATRLESLRYQRFRTIESENAAEPPIFYMHKRFDVVVTNPPFAKWEDNKYDKREIIRRYFHNQVGLASNIRLEHMMAGLALHCMRDSGKAAIIIMGHIYFGSDGYIAKYRPFFNWLYRHYKVDDVINMNSFKLYNKQGAIEKTMLILIGGRKAKPEGVSPRKEQAPHLENMVDSFEELWERVSRHTGYTLDTIVTQLKITLGK